MSGNQDDTTRQALPDGYAKIDRRYQESKNYLMEKMRYSEPCTQFRSIKQALLGSSEFCVGQRAFQFARVAVEAGRG